MPASSTEGERSTSTSEKRASYCSLRFFTKRGQCAVPGMMLLSAANIWQPLQMPSAKRVAAREEALELRAHRVVEQDRLRPALAGAEHVAVGEAAAGDEPLELASERRRG